MWLLILQGPSLAGESSRTLQPSTPLSAATGASNQHHTEQNRSEGSLNQPIDLGKPGLSLRISLCSLTISGKSVDAWLYQTNGLAVHGAPELFLIVRRESGEASEAFPRQPIMLLQTLAENRVAGQKYLPDAYSEIPFDFLAPQFKGVAYSILQKTDRVTPTPTGLCIVALTAPELQCCRVVGSSRTFGRLIWQSGYYPLPYWCDRKRTSAISNEDVEKMTKDQMVGNVCRLTSNSSVLFSRPSCKLRITAPMAKMLSDALGNTKAKPPTTTASLSKLVKVNLSIPILRMSLRMDPTANSFIVYNPDQTIPVPCVVGLEGAEINGLSGQYLLFVGGQPEDSLSEVDDGYVFRITDKSLDRLIDGLAKQQELTFPLEDDTTAVNSPECRSFSVEWLPKE
jgi:hypothetical protein